MGVIVANVLAQSGFNPFQHPEHVAALGDRAVFRAIIYLVDGRFMALVSILFGIGFGLQVQRAASRGEPLLPRYARRLLVLAAIGPKGKSYSSAAPRPPVCGVGL